MQTSLYSSSLRPRPWAAHLCVIVVGCLIWVEPVHLEVITASVKVSQCFYCIQRLKWGGKISKEKVIFCFDYQLSTEYIQGCNFKWCLRNFYKMFFFFRYVVPFSVGLDTLCLHLQCKKQGWLDRSIKRLSPRRPGFVSNVKPKVNIALCKFVNK